MRESQIESIDLEPEMELWDLVADWIGREPRSTHDMINIAATLFHVAAASWKQFLPPDSAYAFDVLTSANFVALARQMFDESKPHDAVIEVDKKRSNNVVDFQDVLRRPIDSIHFPKKKS